MMVLTSVIRHRPMLTSHILMVLSLEPDSRKGPGFPLLLVWWEAEPWKQTRSSQKMS